MMVKTLATKTLTLCKKYSPEILLVAGGVLVIGGTILACRATLKLEEKTRNYNEALRCCREDRKELDKEEYPDTDYRKELVTAHAKRALTITKLYAPSFVVMSVGLGFIGCSYHIQHTRTTMAIAAYNAVDLAFKNYRNNVVADQGEEKDDLYYHGGKTVVEKEVIDESGKKKKSKEEVTLSNPYHYKYLFDETTSKLWTKSCDRNLNSIEAAQKIANTRLSVVGHIFGNEVLDLLQMPRTTEGAVMGWIYDPNVPWDQIDFGIWTRQDEATRNFIDKTEPSVWLDLKYDGVIYDLI